MKIRTTFAVLLVSLLSVTLAAQANEPVVQAIVKETNGETFLEWIRPEGAFLEASLLSPGLPLNGQPTVSFSGGSTTASELEFSARGVTVFIVYRDIAPAVEQELWRLTENGGATIVHTSKRIYLPEEGLARYFHGLGGDWARISAYTLGSSAQHEQPYSFKLGGTSSGRPFAGEIAEVLVYPRVLSVDEQQTVNTRLSLRYGIPLFSTNRLRYRNGEVTLWDSPATDPMRHRVTGIGKENAWDWNPQSAGSSYEKGLLQVRLDNDFPPLPDGSFLLWGDNGNPLTMTSGGMGQRSRRNWKMQTQNWDPDQSVDVVIDGGQFPMPENAGALWWMVIDTTGGQFFAPGQTIFVRSTSEQRREIVFQDALESLPLARNLYFSFTRAPAFFLHHSLQLSICDDNLGLEVKPIGGREPYEYVFHNSANEELERGAFPPQSDYLFWEVLLPDATLLTVIDADGQSASIDILRSKHLLTQFGVHPTYYIGELLQPDLPVGTTAFYEAEGGQIHRLFPVRLDQPGEGRLILEQGGCREELTIEVTGEQDPFYEFNIINNPSIGGAFGLEAVLDQPYPLSLTVRDVSGRRVMNQSFSPRRLLSFSNTALSLPPGIYHITLSAMGFSRSTRIVAQ